MFRSETRTISGVRKATSTNINRKFLQFFCRFFLHSIMKSRSKMCVFIWKLMKPFSIFEEDKRRTILELKHWETALLVTRVLLTKYYQLTTQIYLSTGGWRLLGHPRPVSYQQWQYTTTQELPALGNTNLVQ